MAEDIVQDLYRLAFMPGVFRCIQCGFILSKQTMCVSSGEIGTTEGNRESERCPNDGVFMVHVTYQETCEEQQKEIQRLLALLNTQSSNSYD